MTSKLTFAKIATTLGPIGIPNKTHRLNHEIRVAEKVPLAAQEDLQKHFTPTGIANEKR